MAAARTVKVVLADDHPLAVRGVELALGGVDGIELVGKAGGSAELLALIERTDPDVALVDLRMPEGAGLASVEQIRQRHPRVKVIVLSVSTSRDDIESALQRGASAYIVKTIDPRDLAGAIRQVVEASVYHAPPAVEEDAEHAAATTLSARELEILRAVADGLSNPAIARELQLAEQTVKFHLTKIFRKLGVGSRSEAVRHAYSSGLIAIPIEP